MKLLKRSLWLLVLVDVLIVVTFYATSSKWGTVQKLFVVDVGNREEMSSVYRETTEAVILKMTPSLNKTHYNPDVKSHTCAQYTTIDVYSTSDTFHAMITARNCYNKTKSFGGDYFRAVIRQNDQNGISCIVEDLHNGSYHVSAPVMFSGLAKFEVQLIHSSESVYAISNKTASFLQPLNDLKVFIKTNNTEVLAKCNIEITPEKYHRMCDYSNTKLNESFFCVLPRDYECGALSRSNGSYANKEALGKNGFSLSQLKKISFKEISKESHNFTTIKHKEHLPPCTCLIKNECEDRDKLTGYFSKGHWKTFACKNNEFFINNPRMFEKCLQNKTLYLVGDSTMRQWWEYFENNLNMSVNKKDEKASLPPRYGQILSGNGRIMFRAHGEPIRSKGTHQYYKYVADTLASIVDKTIENWIVLSIGLHFQRYSPFFYLKRIRKIKEEIVNLISRMPSTKVFIKEISMHVYTTACPSPWLSERMNRILRHEFDDVTNVIIIRVWDMTSVIISKDVHPSKFIVSQQIALFQSMACADMTF